MWGNHTLRASVLASTEVVVGIQANISPDNSAVACNEEEINVEHLLTIFVSKIK